MKKITNNTMLGKLTIVLNVAVLVFFIISMLMLMKFDKTNKVVVSERNGYEKAYEEYAGDMDADGSTTTSMSLFPETTGNKVV